MSKYITFGEIMLRLSPTGCNKFIQSERFDALFGGSEANVGVGLAMMGEESVYITKLPENPIGDSARNALRKYGVDTSAICRGGKRIGIYYLEKGADARPSNVVYDRSGSSFAEADFEDFDFEKAMSGAAWLHLSGITPALSDNMTAITKKVIALAKKNGCKVSMDLNYRSKLWSTQKAGAVLSELISGIDMLIANEEHCKMLFGVNSDGISDETEKYRFAAKEMSEKFNIKKVVITIRHSISSSENEFSALIFSDGEYALSAKYPMLMVDRVGGGDAFAAGLLYATEHKDNLKDIIEFAVASGVLKHSINGDFPLSNIAEIENLVKSGRSGRLSR